MNKISGVWLGVGLISALLALSGCGRTTAYDKTLYVLDPVRTNEAAATSRDSVLEVGRFTIDSAFADKNLVYRTGELEYETDFYHEFLVSPTMMIREATRNWLAESNLFAQVADAGSQVGPTYTLEATITALYGDTRNAAAAKAVLELRVFLLQVEGTRDPVLLHSAVYSAYEAAPTADADGVVAGFNACLQAILGDLEKDLAAKL